MGRNLGLGEAVDLHAHGLDGLVEPEGAHRRAEIVDLQEGGECRAGGPGVALGQEPAHGVGAGRGHRILVEAEIAQPHGLALVHGHAGEDLGQVLAEADAHDQRFRGAEGVLAGEPLGVVGELAQRLGVGGEPGKAVHAVLVGLHPRRVDAAVDQQRGPHAGARPGQQTVDRRHGFLRARDQRFLRHLGWDNIGVHGNLPGKTRGRRYRQVG